MPFVRSVRPFSLALALAGASAGAALAVLPPESYVAARREAGAHVQVKVLSVQPPTTGAGPCQVSAEVAVSFTGPLAPGTPLKFAVSCYRFGLIPEGDTLWTDFDALAAARYLEAFLDLGPAPRIARDQVEIILAPRETPYCAVDSLNCETSLMLAPAEVARCGLFDQMVVLFGLLGEACPDARDEAAETRPALRQ